MTNQDLRTCVAAEKRERMRQRETIGNLNGTEHDPLLFERCRRMYVGAKRICAQN